MEHLKRYEKGFLKSFTLHICGMGESLVDEKIRPIIETERKLESESVSFAILAHQMIIDVKANVQGNDEMILDETIHNLKLEFKEVLQENIYGEDKETLESVVGNLLAKNGRTLSVAESCTGGLLSHRITNIPGSSMYFKEGVVTYSNESKIKNLNVRRETIEGFGAVSEETALEMVRGIKRISDSDYAISITGIAGPSGGTKEKPVGLVYIGLSTPKADKVFNFNFSGGRIDIRQRSANFALDILRRELLKEKHRK
jgi:nicotinamide-nucleotide amidase